MSRRAVIAVSTAVVLAATLGAASGLTPSPGEQEPCATALECGTLLNEASSIENRIDDHMVDGNLVGSFFTTDAQQPGTTTGSGEFADSGLWSGVYLGGESMRYALAKKHLAVTPTSAYWKLQLSQSTSRIETLVDTFDRNTNIAVGWNTTLKVPPTVDPSGSVHQADFGGGIIRGEKGMLMRACTVVGVKGGIVDNGPDDRVYGPFPWKGQEWNCETGPSRDTYAGTTFGMLTAFDLVSPDFPAMRDELRTDLLSIGSFLVEHGWNYVQPSGGVDDTFGFDNFIYPLMEQVPFAQLNIVNAADHVADNGGSALDKTKWDALWKAEVATELPLLAGSVETDVLQPNNDYYKFNLHHLTGFNLMRTNTGAVRDGVAAAMGVMDKTTGDDLNAHFSAITYALTGQGYRLDAGISALDQWIQYRANTSGGVAVKNSARCGVSITCVPDDSDGVTLDDGTRITYDPGSSSTLESATPLPIADRPPTDFLWQRTPTQLDGQQPANYSEPGIDFTTPYWMMRYFTEVTTPAVTPFPDDPLPASY